MKVLVAQMNPTVGDLEGNFQKAKAIVCNAPKDVELIVFSELVTIGYPPKDLLEKPAFVQAVLRYNKKWAALSKSKTTIVFGSILRNNHNGSKKLFNCALAAFDGKTKGYQEKTLLPTYDVFDEARYFSPSNGQCLWMTAKNGATLGITICEDAWNDRTFWKERLYSEDHVKDVAPFSDILINISASPFALGKPAVRQKMISHLASTYKKPFIYVNQVGGNDDVIYDGNSLVFNAEGELCAELKPFETNTFVIDTGNLTPIEVKENNQYEQLYKALVLGIRDYANKTGFTKAVIGLSGGIDSALVAVLAAEALGTKNVLGISMPSHYSSDGSKSDALKLAQNLGVDFTTIPIKDVHSSYMNLLSVPIEDLTKAKTDGKVPLWEENIQARIRGAILMAVSNSTGALLLTTGNKSEFAMGYCTLYGDMCGGLAVINDLFKTKVYGLCEYINRDKEIIPRDTITKPPSAELKPNQKDQDTLPPYDILDKVLQLYIEDAMETEEINKKLKLPKKFVAEIIRKVDRNEYKRKQAPLGLKVTRKAFGVGRCLSIAQKWNG